MPMRLTLLLMMFCATTPVLASEPTGERKGEVLSEYSPLAEQHEFIRRAMLPTTADRMLRFEAEGGTTIKPHVLDLTREKIDVYIPAKQPKDGYGVLVFVPPSPSWPVPADYRRVLDARGLIWVAARESGNNQSAYDRRMPLALHALEWVKQRYPVDPSRLYISGFSGGGRVAQRLALAYADVFSGALLIAGNDPFDENGTVVPPRDIFRKFQSTMRIVHATGIHDLPNRRHEERTRASMASFCVAHLFRHIQQRTEHWIPNRRGFARALEDLETPRDPPASQAACLAALDAEVSLKLQAVRDALASERLDEAGELLAKIDQRYGGLAAPESIELAQALAKARSQ
ncbi:MAG: hypothetical protein IPK97_06510 [Ahniella sp.]|nr:hypothetical protein [Ahniella sp.]